MFKDFQSAGNIAMTNFVVRSLQTKYVVYCSFEFLVINNLFSIFQHRVQSILNFDKVIVLDAGRIAEIGNPKDLQEVKGSIFASLVKASHQQH